MILQLETRVGNISACYCSELKGVAMSVYRLTYHFSEIGNITCAYDEMHVRVDVFKCTLYPLCAPVHVYPCPYTYMWHVHIQLMFTFM